MSDYPCYYPNCKKHNPDPQPKPKKKKLMPKTKTITITGCMGCPHMKNMTGSRGNRNIECWHPTKLRVVSFGTIEFPDEIKGKMIAEGCEGPWEYPKDFPRWCPL